MPLNLDPHFNSVVLSCPFNVPQDDDFSAAILAGIRMEGYNSNGDPNVNSVTLNMRMEGVAGGAGFVDDLGKTVTVSGAAVLSSAIKKFGDTSGYFNGSSFLSIGNPSTLDYLSTEDFTLECWVYPTAFPSTSCIFSTWPVSNNNTVGYRITFDSAGTLAFTHANTVGFVGGGNLTLNTWAHVALTKSGATFRLFLNGVQIGSMTSSAQPGVSLYAFVGKNYSEWYYSGYIDDLRITRGVARYTANFTVPDAIPEITGSPYSEVKGRPLTTPNGPLSMSTISKVGSRSVYFDGVNDYIRYASLPNIGGISELTIEAWVYQTSYTKSAIFTENYSTTISCMLGFGGIETTPFAPQCGHFTGGTWFGVNSPDLLTLNTWNHLAAVFSNGTWKLYVNGILKGTSSASTIPANDDAFYIGTRWDSNGGSPWFAGYVDDLIVTKAEKYTANFTPSFQPFNVETNNQSIKDFSISEKTLSRLGAPVVVKTPGAAAGALRVMKGNTIRILPIGGTDFTFGLDDFTIEFRVKFPSSPEGAFSMLDMRPNANGSFITIHLETGGKLGLYVNTAYRIQYSHGFVTNQWYHIAVARKGGITRMFQDGILKGSFSDPTVYANPTSGVYLGSNNGSVTFTTEYDINCFFDDLRITKGVCRYTGGFTPPAEIGTSLARVFKDEKGHFSKNNSGVGVAIQSTNQFKFGTSSFYGLGGTTSQYISFSGESEFAFGLDDFTIEFWIRPEALSGTILDFRPAGTSGAFICMGVSPTTLTLHVNATDIITATHSMIAQGPWYHVALCRVSRVSRIFVDGVMIGSVTDNNNYTVGSDGPIIGQNGYVRNQYGYNGYIDELRMTKNIGRYTTTFTPPTAAFNDTDPYWPEVVLLMHFEPETGADVYETGVVLNLRGEGRSPNGDSETSSVILNIATDGGRLPNGDSHNNNVILNMRMNGAVDSTSILDDTGKTITVSGNTKLSSTQKKFGGTSCYFDGSGDYFDVASSYEFSMFDDFTAEFWIFTDPSTAAWSRVLENETFDVTGGWHLNFNGTDSAGLRRLGFQVGNTGGGGGSIYSDAAIPTSQWVHIAAVRSSGVVSLFVNGVKQTATLTTSEVFTSQKMRVGATLGTATNFFTGYIDDLRITKGVARYTATFTPSIRKIPKSTLASLKDDCGSTVTAVGTATLSSTKTKRGVFSLSCTGNGNYFSIPTSTKFKLDGNFTIEGWFYYTGSSVAYPVILSSGHPSFSTGAFNLTYDANTTPNALNLAVANVGNITHQTTGADNTWHHFAIVRSGTTVTLFLNGVASSTSIMSSSPFDLCNGAASPFYLGRAGHDAAQSWSGFLSDIRISKSVARYSSTFTPTVIPRIFEASGVVDDANNVVQGFAECSVSQKKYGNRSLYFDGQSGSYISMPAANFVLGAKDFTIECWVYKLADNPNEVRVWACGADVHHDVSFGITASGAVGVWLTTTGTGWQYSLIGPILQNNQWYHIAVQRQGGIVYLFVNGESYIVTSSLGATTLHPGSQSIRTIGGQAGINRNLTGYIDNYRVTIGAARYNLQFTPPSVPFEDFYTISGVVRDDSNDPCSRVVRAHSKARPEVYFQTVSDPITGAYSFVLPVTEYYLVFFDDDAGDQHNALILDKVMPA